MIVECRRCGREREVVVGWGESDESEIALSAEPHLCERYLSAQVLRSDGSSESWTSESPGVSGPMGLVAQAGAAEGLVGEAHSVWSYAWVESPTLNG